MTSVKLFPTIEEVFVDNFEQNNKHFMPIATIDLSLIDKSLSGQIHLVYYNNDPYCQETAEFSNEYCDDYKASFDIIDNKYVFKADFGFFKTNEDWIEWLEKGRKSYEENLNAYRTEKDLDISGVIKNIGEQPDWLQDDEWPTNQHGEKLTFICQVWSGDFVSDYCEEEIFLFYDNTNKIAVQIHQVD